MNQLRHTSVILCSLLTLASPLTAASAEGPSSAKAPNPQAIEEVRAEKRTDANAAWWGFDPEDATESLQSAIDSGARTVVVPYMGRPWIVRPIKLRGRQEIVFEPGVMVLAKKDEFRGTGDSLFRAVDQADITIRGYGATLRMRKKDYQQPPYKKAEWRMGLSLTGCQRVLVEGLRIESSGGDGIYLGATAKNRWCQDVTIRNVVCHDNHRQGISVISAQNLLIENCTLSDTRGTAPAAGIDFEPNGSDERLVNCLVRNCVMVDNDGNAILIYLRPLSAQSEPVSIRFENCISCMGQPGQSHREVAQRKLGGHAGMAVGAIKDDGPTGLVEFRNCVAENTGHEGAMVYDKSTDGVLVRFVNCSWRNPWTDPGSGSGEPRAAVLLHLRRPQFTQKPGGVEFVDCTVYDDADRPVLQTRVDKDGPGFCDVRGSITGHSQYEPRMDLDPKSGLVQIRLYNGRHVNEPRR